MNGARFPGIGIELEYMIVHKDTLSVYPVADQILKAFGGKIASEIDMGALLWSNELVLHVIELKSNGPASSLLSLVHSFQNDISKINRFLDPMNGCLLPTGMHPLMDPFAETVLWPHEYNPIYETFNRIFDCRGHGWANLQSMHINLPFSDEETFGRLHAAIRLILPIFPGLSASSPIVQGKYTGRLDNRLEFYRINQKKIPSLTGDVIPEPIFTPAAYQNQILNRLYQDLSPYDPEEILKEEWVNSRGAIARFERNTIEIRVLDMQECPLADLAIAGGIIEVIQWLMNEGPCNFETQKQFPSEPLIEIFLSAIQNAEQAFISHQDYLRVLGIHSSGPISIKKVWERLFESVSIWNTENPWKEPLQIILQHGSLATRIVQALGENPDEKAIQKVYRSLAQSLSQGQLFVP